MRIGSFLPATEVEGPGLRAAVWFQGCSIQCPRCCNPGYLPFDGGTEEDPLLLAREMATLPVEGVTILGGEPFDQPEALRAFLLELRRLSALGIIVFSGHSWDEITAGPGWHDIIQCIDLLIAGPFVHALTPDSRRWIGSRNQTVHFITERYSALRSRWPPALKEIEIHLRGDEIVINGTPLADDPFAMLVEEVK